MAKRPRIGRVTTVQEIRIREKCSVRRVNMTMSLGFLPPNRVKAAVEGSSAAGHRCRAASRSTNRMEPAVRGAGT